MHYENIICSKCGGDFKIEKSYKGDFNCPYCGKRYNKDKIIKQY